MSKRILILDDDPDFTSLLTDIFKQSSYETVPFFDPRAALSALRSDKFDMLVTDHRMPGMTGEVLVRELRKTDPDMPVVVVSGFLDNDTIRELIRDGVGGIFLKPLNVVNLLKRTATLLNEADAAGNRLPSPGEEELRHRLPFPFESFPCLCGRTIDFANQLHSKRGFKGTLTLTAPPGTNTAAILRDLERFDSEHYEPFTVFGHGEIGANAIVDALAERDSGRQRTLVFKNPDLASPQARRAMMDLGAHRAPFNNYPVPRLIFVFSHSVDELFEKGRVEEELYLQASVTEIAAPALTECPDEIPVIAGRILDTWCAENEITPRLRLHKLAHIWLKDRPWPGNYEELAVHVRRAAESPQAGLLTRESFSHESHDHQWIDSAEGITSLETYLGRLRDDYIRATLILCEGDISLAAETLGVSQVMLATHPLAKPRASNPPASR